MTGLGAHLRGLREQTGLSQAEVADRAGVTRETVNAIERGRRDPRFGIVLRYCTAIGARIVIAFPPKEQR